MARFNQGFINLLLLCDEKKFKNKLYQFFVKILNDFLRCLIRNQYKFCKGFLFDFFQHNSAIKYS